jgi:hypothetical protein
MEVLLDKEPDHGQHADATVLELALSPNLESLVVDSIAHAQRVKVTTLLCEHSGELVATHLNEVEGGQTAALGARHPLEAARGREPEEEDDSRGEHGSEAQGGGGVGAGEGKRTNRWRGEEVCVPLPLIPAP